MKMKLLTVSCYIIACVLDAVTSLALLGVGFGEHNSFYAILGFEGFWILYFFVSAGLLILLLWASTKWWWAYLILWINTTVHLICGVHNIMLF